MPNHYVVGTGAEEISLLFGHREWPEETFRGITYRLPTYGGSEAGFLRYHAAGHKFTSEDGTELMLLNHVGGNPGAWFPGDVGFDGSLGVNGDITTIYDVGGLRISGSNFGGSGATLNLASDNIGDANRYDVTFARSGTKILEYDYSSLHWNFQNVDLVNAAKVGAGNSAPRFPGHFTKGVAITPWWDTSSDSQTVLALENGAGVNTELLFKMDSDRAAFITVGDSQWRYYMGWTGSAHATIPGKFEINTGVGGFEFYTSAWDTGLRITNDSQVGIGLTDPEAPLHVVGPGGKMSGTRPTLTNILAAFESADGINANVALVIPATKSGNIQAFRAGSTTAFGVMRFDEATGDFVVRTGDGLGAISDKFRIWNDGRTVVGGAGTYAPGRNLEIHATGGSGGVGRPGLRFVNETLNDRIFNIEWYDQATRAGYLASDVSGNITLSNEVAGAAILLNTASTERMRITSTGDVGIGTTSPEWFVDMAGTGTRIAQIRSTDSGAAQLRIKTGATTNRRIVAVDGADAVKWNIEFADAAMTFCGATVSSHEYMRIDSSGYVGIGTTPGTDALLRVNGKIKSAERDGYHVWDTRAAEYLPSQYASYSASFDFTSEITGSVRAWDGILTVGGWTASSYGRWQLMGDNSISITDGFLYHRHGSASTWGPLRRIVATDANDKVGLGTAATSPTYNIHVQGTGNQNIIAESNGGNGTGALLARGNGTGQAHLILAGGGKTPYTDSFEFIQDNAGSGHIQTRGNNHIYFRPNATLRGIFESVGGLRLYGATTANRLIQFSDNSAYYNAIYSNLSDSANYGMIMQLQGGTSFNFETGPALGIVERGAAPSAAATWGKVWTKNTTPNELWFTDDAGGSTQLSMKEGTWTPVIWDLSYSNAESQTYTVQNGYYWVIGNLCFLHVDIAINSLGTLSTGDAASIGQLPFSASYGNFLISFSYGNSLAMPAGGSHMIARIIGSTNRAVIEAWDLTTGTSAVSIGELSAGARLIGNGWYRIQ